MQNYVDRMSSNPEQSNCNCLPDCTSITYDVELLQSPFKVDEFLAATKVMNDNSSRTLMSIFIKDKQFIALHRSEWFGMSGFLANCGGLLGLFLGLSVLSLVKIVYFVSLRLICNWRMRTNHSHSDGPGVGDVENVSAAMKKNETDV